MATKLLVRPTTPTAAGDTQRLPLNGTDLWLYVLTEYMIIVPGIIDAARFQAALSDTLALAPEFAGRLKNDAASGSWWIELTNSSVPLYVDENSKEPLPADTYVVFEDINQISPYVVSTRLDSWNKDLPLVQLKLTMNKALNYTAIGYSVNHIVADAHGGHQFLGTISRLYQGLQPTMTSKYPIPDPPLNVEVAEPPDESQAGPSFWASQRTSLDESNTLYYKDYRETVQVRARFSPQRIELLRALMRDGEVSDDSLSSAGPSASARISRQDTLSAYVAHLLTHCCESSTPINFIRNNLNFRGNGCIPEGTIGTNAVVFIQTPLLGDRRDLASYAQGIRNSIIRAKSSKFCQEDLVYAQQTMMETANRKECYTILSPPDCLTVNGLANVDWGEVHFGHPGRGRFHTKWLASRYLRTFRSNPELAYNSENQDPVIVDPRLGWVDVQFGVHSRDYKKVTERIASDMASLDAIGALPSYEPSWTSCVIM